MALSWSNDYRNYSGFGWSGGYGRFNDHHYSAFREVDLHCQTNNNKHHTSEISVKQLIVRRGQPFNITLKMAKPFNPDSDQLIMKAETGKYPSEKQGTMSLFGVPDKVERSFSAKAVWKIELQKNNVPEPTILYLNITPPADTPIGEYKLSAQLRAEEKELAKLSVLFNPWCSDDWVFLPNEEEREEYVMNEHGIIYTGADHYISKLFWDFGQFEEDMVQICLKILDLNIKHKRDPADDVSARCNPIYVSRVISNMINNGILEGNWSNDFRYGKPPTHWSGSYAILKQWYASLCSTVKYGQCWVFAGVMCSVMRLLGIPCRVVTNFQSAHDTNQNLIVDNYYDEYGVKDKATRDSIWNFHVWVEGWMRRPDLADDGRYDGWQVLDATPQEKSEGLNCCGPAPVKAILNGDTHLKYDVPFVFAEVNADCVNWQIKRDGYKIKMSSDTKTVGQHISTKRPGSNQRLDITDTYKHREGTEQERNVFRYALDRLANGTRGGHFNGVTYTLHRNEAPQLTVQFEQESTPVNGQDVNLKLVLNSEDSAARKLSINISVQAMSYTGKPVANIQNQVIEKKLLPGRDLIVPIHVPYSTYNKHMVHCKSMTISAMITDLNNEDHIYLATERMVLKDPPITITVSDKARVKNSMSARVAFTNPISKILRHCTLTLSGRGLFYGEKTFKLPDLMPNQRLLVKLNIVPYKSGEKTLLVDFDCASFRDIKTSCIVHVKP
ncbi:protein-glutamine gamma-glutamyltransferase E-like [Fundulus diaphanus]